MKTLEFTGKTVDEAIQGALSKLGKTLDEVEIEVLEKESKGVLGLFGTKDAKIKVSFESDEIEEVIEEVVEETPVEVIEEVVKKEPVKSEVLEEAKAFAAPLFEKMGVDAEITGSLNDNVLSLDIKGEDSAILIGRKGQTLDSLQYLISLVVNKNSNDYIRVALDCENYREKRKEAIEKMAIKKARLAKKLRKDIVLEPMNAFERRIIHSTLQSDKYVSTKSEGKEPNRRVIIFLNR